MHGFRTDHPKTLALTMYNHSEKVPELDHFEWPFDHALDPENRWIKLAALIPWKLVEELYIQSLSDSGLGAPAESARLAFGALIIKERLGVSDRETVEQIKENPYLQFFVGRKGFDPEGPFDASMMTHYRKRFPAESLNVINEAMVKGAEEDSEGEEPVDSEALERKGKILLDATCTPADIRYPTDLSLLNEAREKLEGMIDHLHGLRTGKPKKPRTYRQKARRHYLAIAKRKRVKWSQLRKGVTQQLRYISRDLKHVDSLLDEVGFEGLKPGLLRSLWVVREVYRQQRWMVEGGGGESSGSSNRKHPSAACTSDHAGEGIGGDRVWSEGNDQCGGWVCVSGRSELGECE